MDQNTEEQTVVEIPQKLQIAETIRNFAINASWADKYIQEQKLAEVEVKLAGRENEVIKEDQSRQVFEELGIKDFTSKLKETMPDINDQKLDKLIYAIYESLFARSWTEKQTDIDNKNTKAFFWANRLAEKYVDDFTKDDFEKAFGVLKEICEQTKVTVQD